MARQPSFGGNFFGPPPSKVKKGIFSPKVESKPERPKQQQKPVLDNESFEAMVNLYQALVERDGDAKVHELYSFIFRKYKNEAITLMTYIKAETSEVSKVEGYDKFM